MGHFSLGHGVFVNIILSQQWTSVACFRDISERTIAGDWLCVEEGNNVKGNQLQAKEQFELFIIAIMNNLLEIAYNCWYYVSFVWFLTWYLVAIYYRWEIAMNQNKKLNLGWILLWIHGCQFWN